MDIGDIIHKMPIQMKWFGWNIPMGYIREIHLIGTCFVKRGNTLSNVPGPGSHPPLGFVVVMDRYSCVDPVGEYSMLDSCEGVWEMVSDYDI